MENTTNHQILCHRCLQSRPSGGALAEDRYSFHYEFCKECYDILKEKNVTFDSMRGHRCELGHVYMGEEHLSCLMCEKLDKLKEVKTKTCSRCLQKKPLGGYIPALLKTPEQMPFCVECYSILKQAKIGMSNMYGHFCKEGHGFLGEKYLSCLLCKDIEQKTLAKGSLIRLKKPHQV